MNGQSRTVVRLPAMLGERSAGARVSNLAFALRRLPAPLRKDMLIYYNFCRTVDDVADDPNRPADERLCELNGWRQALAGEPHAPELPRDFCGVLKRHRVDVSLPLALLEGLIGDVKGPAFETNEDLRRYCWQVAGSVGLACNTIAGCRHPASRDYAETLGEALQLTNILRDVEEDARMERVYFPEQMLRRHGLSREQFLKGPPGPHFGALWRELALRAQALFARIANGPPRQDRASLAAAETMRAIYQGLLEKMWRDGWRVFEKRYRPGVCEKARALFLDCGL